VNYFNQLSAEYTFLQALNASCATSCYSWKCIQNSIQEPWIPKSPAIHRIRNFRFKSPNRLNAWKMRRSGSNDGINWPLFDQNHLRILTEGFNPKKPGIRPKRISSCPDAARSNQLFSFCSQPTSQDEFLFYSDFIQKLDRVPKSKISKPPNSRGLFQKWFHPSVKILDFPGVKSHWLPTVPGRYFANFQPALYGARAPTWRPI